MLHDLALGDADATRDAQVALATAGPSWTRGQLRDAVARIAGVLSTLTPPGSTVAIASDARPEVVALLLAIPAAGRVAVPLNTRLTGEEMADQMGFAGVSAVAGTAEELGRLGPHLGRAPSLRTKIGLDPGAGDITLTALMTAPTRPPQLATDPDAPAWIIFTSGTTGRAKGVTLTARSLTAAVRATAAARPLADDDVYLYPFPLYHVSAYNVLHALHRERPVVLPRRFVTDDVVDLVARHGVTTMSVAPTMLRMLLDHREAADDPSSVLAGVRTLAYGAAPMQPSLLAEADATLGVDFAQGYGMTELSGNAVFLPPDAHRAALAGDERLLHAAGWPGPGVEVEIRDEQGRALPPGEPGEIVVRGEQVCAGYWEDPEATAASIIDGWLATGDIGTLDTDGLLTIVDRAKDVIVTGGENVSSREVEAVVSRHPAVAKVAVIGVPHERWGEAVCAVVVRRSGVDTEPTVLAADIVTQAEARLARFKVPKRIEFVEDLPTNAGGKIQKHELRQMLAARDLT